MYEWETLKINKTYKHEFTRLHKTCIHIQNTYKYMTYIDRYTAALHIISQRKEYNNTCYWIRYRPISVFVILKVIKQSIDCIKIIPSVFS